MFYLDCTKSQQVWSGSEPKVWFLLCFTRTIVLLSSYWAESHDTPVVEITTYSFLSLVTWDKCCIFSSAAYPVDAMTWPGYISTSTLPSCCAMGARILINNQHYHPVVPWGPGYIPTLPSCCAMLARNHLITVTLMLPRSGQGPSDSIMPLENRLHPLARRCLQLWACDGPSHIPQEMHLTALPNTAVVLSHAAKFPAN